jgi:adenylate cyclase
LRLGRLEDAGMRRFRQTPQTLVASARSVAALGTAGYPPRTCRRLQNINVGSFTIALSCLLFALTYALEDFALYRGAAAINLAMGAAALAVPAFHRINDTAGAIFISAALLIGLFSLVALLGRQSGIQINFVAASAAAFLVFDLRRRVHIVALIVTALVLHILAWMLFPQGAIDAVDESFMLQIYITIATTIAIIIAILVYYAFWTAEQAEAATEALLLRILPAAVAERLKANPAEPIADSIGDASVLFSDLAGFVPIARSLGPARTVAMLNHLVSGFDRLAAEQGVSKIKTIGDAYMAVSGLPWPTPDSAAKLAEMALRMQAVADDTAQRFGVTLRLRIGIAQGPVMAGVIGSERFSYDVWGDPVNLAARLESTGEPGRIQVSSGFRDTLSGAFEFAPRGAIPIKGVGEEDTWFLIRAKGDPP